MSKKEENLLKLLEYLDYKPWNHAVLTEVHLFVCKITQKRWTGFESSFKKCQQLNKVKMIKYSVNLVLFWITLLIQEFLKDFCHNNDCTHK